MGPTQTQVASSLQALGFDDPATLALFEQISQGIGVPIDNTILEFSNNQALFLQTITQKNYGKSGYYEGWAKAFQLGDDLIIDPTTGNDIYAVIDASKQIITQAAFEELVQGQNVQLFLKIAKTDPVSGLLVPLLGTELAEFQPYFQTAELPGIAVSIVNNAANVLAFNANVTFYKTYNLTTLQTKLLAALNSFLSTFQFNGEFFNGDLSDYVKANVPGVRDFFIYGTTLDGIGFSGDTLLSSGYFNYLPQILSNIATAFNYIPV